MGLAPTFPVIWEVWLPVSVIPVFDKIAKLPAEDKSTDAGPAANTLIDPTKPNTKLTTNAVANDFLLIIFIYLMIWLNRLFIRPLLIVMCIHLSIPISFPLAGDDVEMCHPDA